MTDAQLAEIEARAARATPGPWAVETCGEKGDGSDMIGVVFGPDDENCDHQLSGELPAFGIEGEEIEYYRDELVAECEHRNRNSHSDAAFIAAARTDIPALVAEVRRLREALLAVTQRANESGTGMMGVIDTIHAVHSIARAALEKPHE